MFTHFYTIAAVMVLAVISFPQKSLAFELEWDQTEAKVELNPGEKEAQARFVVTNKGEETVQIDRIKTSCGCTGSILDKKTIKPGESATIIGTFNKGNRPGLNRNRLQVFIKGQPEPAETLHMVVQVPRLIDVEPSIVYWNRSTSKTERQVRIKLNTKYVNTVSAIDYDPELIVVTEKEDPDDTTCRILTILPKSFDARLRCAIKIKATGENNFVTETKLQVFVQP